MAKTFKWSEKYSVNVESLDEQHKKFFSITNRILEILDEKNTEETRAKLLQLLVELADYAVFHLDYEEDCMQRCHFEGWNDHTDAHFIYRDKVKDFLRSMRESGADIFSIAREAAEFTQNWLSNHILKRDREYITCLVSKHIQ